MSRADKAVTRAQFEKNLAAKRHDATFLGDIHNYIATSAPRYNSALGLDRVASDLVALLSGEPWASV
jgi:hypothetical protein